MVLPAIPVAVIGIIALICIVSGVTFVTAYKRDIATAEVQEEIQLSQDNTVNEILDSSLSDSDKSKLLIEYIEGTTTTEIVTTTAEDQIKTYLPYLVIAAGFMLITRK